MTSKQFTSWHSMMSTHLWFSHRLLANPSWYIHINSVQKLSALFNNSVGKCFLHSFYYIFFDILSLQCLASVYCKHPLLWSGSALTTRNERSQERKFLGTFVPESEGSHWELLLQGAKIPGSEKSWYQILYGDETLWCRLVEHWLSVC